MSPPRAHSTRCFNYTLRHLVLHLTAFHLHKNAVTLISLPIAKRRRAAYRVILRALINFSRTQGGRESEAPLWRKHFALNFMPRDGGFMWMLTTECTMYNELQFFLTFVEKYFLTFYYTRSLKLCRLITFTRKYFTISYSWVLLRLLNILESYCPGSLNVFFF